MYKSLLVCTELVKRKITTIKNGCRCMYEGGQGKRDLKRASEKKRKRKKKVHCFWKIRKKGPIFRPHFSRPLFPHYKNDPYHIFSKISQSLVVNYKVLRTAIIHSVYRYIYRQFSAFSVYYSKITGLIAIEVVYVNKTDRKHFSCKKSGPVFTKGLRLKCPIQKYQI